MLGGNWIIEKLYLSEIESKNDKVVKGANSIGHCNGEHLWLVKTLIFLHIPDFYGFNGQICFALWIGSEQNLTIFHQSK